MRRKLEPKTTTGKQRLKVIEEMSASEIPINVMIAPIIPGLNDHEIPEILKESANVGAYSAAYSTVRLNGQVGDLFTEWIEKAFPDRASKVLNQIKK